MPSPSSDHVELDATDLRANDVTNGAAMSVETDENNFVDLENYDQEHLSNANDGTQHGIVSRTRALGSVPHAVTRQSPTMIDDGDDSYGQEGTFEAHNGASMPPPRPRGSSLDLGHSILRTHLPSTDQNLLKIQKAQLEMKSKLFAAKRARENQSKWGSSSGPASGVTSTVTDGEHVDFTTDDSWNENEETEHKRLATKWKAEKAAYEKRRKNVGTSLEEEIEFIRNQREEEARVRRYNECKQRLAEDQRRSESPDPADHTVDPKPLFVHEDDSDDDMHRHVMPKSKGKRRAKSAHLAPEDEGLKRLLLGNQAKKRKTDSASMSTDQERRRKGKKPSARRKQKAPNPKGHQLSNFDSLLAGSNVIQDAGKNHELGSQPTFTSTRRHEAFKELIATLPTEQRKVNKIDKQYLLSSLKDFLGNRAIKQIPDVGNGESGFLIKGMQSPLKNFQVLGAAFMRRRELSDDIPLGGLVGDQMGLGKTVMMLANIADALAHRPRGEDVPTLIVATPALIKQWENEIRKHLSLDKLGRSKTKAASIMLYMAGNKVKSDNLESIIAGHEFVLTTYDEVRRSFPTNKTPPGFQTSEEKAAYWKEFIAKNKGLLHSILWNRIVLDEAQAIKNRTSQTSLACRYLQGKHRWAMSGTPIQNGVGELYPYFRFLKMPRTGSYKVFKENFIGRQDPDKHDRLQAFLSKVLLRRTHKDRLFNAPLVKLPKPSEKVHFVDFNNFERSIYEIIRRRMIQRINQYSQDGQLEGNYRNVLVMLLRLRQLTGHVLAIESSMRDLLELEDHERIKQLAEDENNPQMEEVRRVLLQKLRSSLAKQHDEDDESHGEERKIKKAKTLRPPANETGRAERGDSIGPYDVDADEELFVQYPPSEEDTPSGCITEAAKLRKLSVGRSHGLSYDFTVYLDSLRQGKEFEELRARQICAICDQPPCDPWITSCFHVMCLDCLTVLQKSAADMERPHARCPECGDLFYKVDRLKGWTLEVQDSDMTDVASDSDQEGKKKRKRKKGKKRKGPDWIDMPNHHILPSSKTTAIKAQILNWLEKDENQKIIIYTQFLNMIRIMQRICTHEGWGYEMYHGGMTLTERNKAVQDFSEKPDKIVLLASLKCGGVGLNLTMASRVIVIDPWWNRAVEDQAFCRVYRIGQAYETNLTRFAVKNTVDEAMINMQEAKQYEIDEVMDDGKGRRSTKLSTKELLRLFGETREDREGNAFILVDDKPECPYLDRDTDDEMYGDED